MHMHNTVQLCIKQCTLDLDNGTNYKTLMYSIPDCTANTFERGFAIFDGKRDVNCIKPMFFGAAVCNTVRPMLSHRCLSVLSVCLSVGLFVLSVTLVHSGQTVGWIKMKLGTQVGLEPGHCVRWEPSSLPQRGTAPNFGKYLLGLNGWMDQDATW